MNGFGRLVSVAQAGTWRDVVTLPQYGRSILLRASVIIIFVHGFDTSLSDAIAKGNAILEALRTSGRTSGKRDLSEQELKFFTFCWRGDLGPTKELPIAFAAAEVAAQNSALSLSSFIKKLQILYPSAKMILMSHSLGARVALEALQNLYKERQSAWIDCLLMVQPAVRWCEVYEGDFLTPEDPSLPTLGGKARVVEPFTGQYSICINAAYEVVVTQSSRDWVLSRHFRGGDLSTLNLLKFLGYQWSRNLASTPDIDIALGSPCGKDGWKVHHRAYREILLSPNPKSAAFNDIHRHWNEDQTIVDLIYNSVLAKYFPAP